MEVADKPVQRFTLAPLHLKTDNRFAFFIPEMKRRAHRNPQRVSIDCAKDITTYHHLAQTIKRECGWPNDNVVNANVQ
jgi:hypothetical protein